MTFLADPGVVEFLPGVEGVLLRPGVEEWEIGGRPLGVFCRGVLWGVRDPEEDGAGVCLKDWNTCCSREFRSGMGAVPFSTSASSYLYPGKCVEQAT